MWSLPITLLGYLQALIGGARFIGFGVYGTAIFANTGRGLIGQFFKRLPVAAYTWGATITLAHSDYVGTAPRLMAHELAHVRQTFAMGPLMPIAYVLASLFAWMAGGHWYRDNSFESAARRAEPKPL